MYVGPKLETRGFLPTVHRRLDVVHLVSTCRQRHAHLPWEGYTSQLELDNASKKFKKDDEEEK